MKKNVKRELCIIWRYHQKITAMVILSILLFLCSITCISAIGPDAEYNYSHKNSLNYLINKPIQQDIVLGTIRDATSGEAMAGVTIVVKGTTLGTISDINGEFSIAIPEKEATLSISFVGYITQEIPVTAGASINVSLVVEVTEISEVIVVGYGTQKKESLVGAISQVNSETLIKSGAPNITNAIAGKLSGVLTIQQTGEPGNDHAEIIIRGLSSWSGSAPLVLIDGIERDFRDMDPNEINTISVLKDASATAVFGSKGANGVIIVTTKRGRLGKPQMTFTGSTGAQVPTRIPSYIDSYTTLSMLNVARMNQQAFTLLTPDHILEEYRNPSTPLNALRYPSIDWFSELAKPFAPTSNANINVTGGTNFIKYFTSLGFLHEGSYFKQEKAGYRDTRYWFNRFNYRANIDFSLTKITQLSLNVGGEAGIKNATIQTGYGDWKSFYGTTGAEFPLYYPAWVLEQIPDIDYPEASGIRRAATYSTWFTNPYNDINAGRFERFLVSRLFTDLVLDQKLDFIFKGLSVKGKVAYNSYYSTRTLYASQTIPTYRILWDRIGTDQNPWERDGQGIEYYYPEPLTVNVGGYAHTTSGLGGYTPPPPYNTDLYYEISLNYMRSFGNHDFTGLALMNRQQKNQGTEFPYYNAAYVGRMTYAFSNKYLFEMNLGYTGSERFSATNRYGFFPAGAVGWIVSEENFFKNAITWINRLKIRYSDGLVGSDYADNRWLYISDYFVDPRGYIHEDLGANASAQWEEARKKDIGIEIGIFQNMFSFTIDLFDEHRTKMLLAPRSTTFLIGNSFKDLNLGSLKKHGIEIEAEFNKTTAYNLNYFIRGNIGINENRILFRDDPVYAPEYTKYEGKPLGYQAGVKRTGTGYYTSIDDIHINPSPLLLQNIYVGDYKFLDFNSDGEITSLDTYPIKGQTYAPVTYSFTSGFNYKGFDFSIMFQGNNGKYAKFGPESMVEFFKGSPRVHSAQLNYWRPDNQNATHSTLHYSGADGGDAIHTWGSNSFEDIFWRNASYLRLKEIYLAYNLNSEFFKRSIGISNILFYANGINVLTFTKLLKEYDPELKSFGGGYYPQLSRYHIGVKFAF